MQSGSGGFCAVRARSFSAHKHSTLPVMSCTIHHPAPCLAAPSRSCTVDVLPDAGSATQRHTASRRNLGFKDWIPN